jgi:hypothetical protein
MIYVISGLPAMSLILHMLKKIFGKTPSAALMLHGLIVFSR